MEKPKTNDVKDALVSRVKPIRAKLCDWFILVLLSITLLLVHMSTVNKQYISIQTVDPNTIIKDPDYLYPYIPEVMVPFNYLLVYSLVPWIALWIITLLSFLMADIKFQWKIIFRKFEMIARMWFATLIVTQLITESLKNGVGRPRPNYYQLYTIDQTESLLSFPSGHASLSFSMLSLLTIHLYYCISYVQNRIFFYHHHRINITLSNSYSYFGLYFFVQLKNYLILCLVIAFLPIGLAMYVSISRVLDYWHHYEDVIAGALIGASVAIVISQSFHFEFYGDRDKKIDDENNYNSNYQNCENSQIPLIKTNMNENTAEELSSTKRDQYLNVGKNSPKTPKSMVINRNNKQLLQHSNNNSMTSNSQTNNKDMIELEIEQPHDNQRKWENV